MKLHYDPETDSLYIDLSEQPSAERREVSAGIVLAYLYYWKGAFAGLHGLSERNGAAAWGKKVLVNKYYFDWLYTDVITGFVKGPLARAANWFNKKVLDGIVDPVKYSKGAEARVGGSVSSSDQVFEKFLSLCEGAGPTRCALAGRPRRPAKLVKALFRLVKRAPIPAPSARPPGELSYGDLLLSQFEPIRSPESSYSIVSQAAGVSSLGGVSPASR